MASSPRRVPRNVGGNSPLASGAVESYPYEDVVGRADVARNAYTQVRGLFSSEFEVAPPLKDLTRKDVLAAYGRAKSAKDLRQIGAVMEAVIDVVEALATKGESGAARLPANEAKKRKVYEGELEKLRKEFPQGQFEPMRFDGRPYKNKNSEITYTFTSPEQLIQPRPSGRPRRRFERGYEEDYTLNVQDVMPQSYHKGRTELEERISSIMTTALARGSWDPKDTKQIRAALAPWTKGRKGFADELDQRARRVFEELKGQR